MGLVEPKHVTFSIYIYMRIKILSTSTLYKERSGDDNVKIALSILFFCNQRTRRTASGFE